MSKIPDYQIADHKWFEIVTRCYNEGKDYQETLIECRRYSKDIEDEWLQERIQEWNNVAKWLNEKIVPNLKKIENS